MKKTMFGSMDDLATDKPVSLAERYLRTMQIVASCWTLLASALMFWTMGMPPESSLHQKLRVIASGSLFVSAGMYSLLLPFTIIQKRHDRGL